MNYIVNNYIANAISTASSAMLDHFVIGVSGEELYAMLCGYDHQMLAAFAHAASYMEPANYHDVLELPVLLRDASQPINVTFTLMMENSQRYNRYLIPKRKAMLTPESKIYSALETSITLAQDWRITGDLSRRFQELTVDQYAHLLPWVKDIARDAVMGLENSASPCEYLRKHGCGHVTASHAEATHAQFKRMSNPSTPGFSPALTMRVNKACRLGDKLFGQYRMLKGKDAKLPVGSYVCVAMTDTMLPEWYRTDITAVMDAWTEKQNLREADRAFARKMKARDRWR